MPFQIDHFNEKLAPEILGCAQPYPPRLAGGLVYRASVLECCAAAPLFDAQSQSAGAPAHSKTQALFVRATRLAVSGEPPKIQSDRA